LLDVFNKGNISILNVRHKEKIKKMKKNEYIYLIAL